MIISSIDQCFQLACIDQSRMCLFKTRYAHELHRSRELGFKNCQVLAADCFNMSTTRLTLYYVLHTFFSIREGIEERPSQAYGTRT